MYIGLAKESFERTLCQASAALRLFDGHKFKWRRHYSGETKSLRVKIEENKRVRLFAPKVPGFLLDFHGPFLKVLKEKSAFLFNLFTLESL